ncbi:FecR domain-containing protein [bacterium]|nr:FecR domain-containing protein [bacterium]
MKITPFFLILLSFVLVSCTTRVPKTDVGQNLKIGEVARFSGNASATLENKRRPLDEGDAVYEGDLIRTGTATRLLIRMADGAEIVLGDGTTLLIERYRFNTSNQEDQAVLQVKQGVFHSKSGRLASRHPDRFRIKTAFAAIGVKGTEFWGGFWESGVFDVALLQGKGVILTNPGGTVEITTIGWGTSLVDETTAPTPPAPWSKEKLARASATVAWEK